MAMPGQPAWRLWDAMAGWIRSQPCPRFGRPGARVLDDVIDTIANMGLQTVVARAKSAYLEFSAWLTRREPGFRVEPRPESRHCGHQTPGAAVAPVISYAGVAGALTRWLIDGANQRRTHICSDG